MHTITNEVWENCGNLPVRFRSLKEIDWREMQQAFDDKDTRYIIHIVQCMAKGDFVVLKHCFSKEESEKIKDTGRRLMNREKSSFFKMLEGVPDFWRDITTKEEMKYSVPAIKKSMYFFPWNGEKELFELVRRPWRIAKTLAGKHPTETESYTPKNGIVDRIQLVKYSAGSGYVARHQDPVENSRLFISGYLSQYGEDFTGGGFYVLNKMNQKVNLERYFEEGDVGLGCGHIVHGVDKIEGRGAEEGERWWLGPYTPSSDTEGKGATWGIDLTKERRFKACADKTMEV